MDNKHEVLRELQLLELEILLEVDRVCKKYDITYYLGEGTLLGAVRHNGFIPWDDDVDILMKRKDYDRFLEVAPQELGEDYYLQNSQSEKNFWVFFSKVRLTRPTEFNQLDIADLTEYNGPYIDIFPLDYVPKKTSFKQLITAKKVTAYRYMLFFRTGALKKPKKQKWGKRTKKQTKRRVLYFMSRFFTAKKLHELLHKECTKFNNKKRKYIVNYFSYYNTTESTIRSRFYGKPRLIEFEGYQLPIPKNAEFLLSAIYGDYMKLPPKKERKIKHKFPAHLINGKNEVVLKIETPELVKEDINISVVIPVYNNGKYIKECLESLYNQTYPYHEIIIINDGSTDDSEQKVLESIEGVEGITYISQENKKQGYTRNYGMKLTTGNYVMFMDADDFLEPKTLELCVKKIKKEDPDFVTFEFKKYYEDTEKYVYDRINKKIDRKEILLGKQCHKLLSEKLYYTIPRVYKKEFLSSNNIAYGEGYFYEDHIFYLKTALMAQKVSLIHAPLYCYRIHDEATTKNNFGTDLHAKDFMRATKDTLAVENLSGINLVYILNHIIDRFVIIYEKKTGEFYQDTFAKEFVSLLSEMDLKLKKKHKQKLNGKMKCLLQSDILETKDVSKIMSVLKPEKTEKNTPGVFEEFKNNRKRKDINYYHEQLEKPMYDNTILFMGFDYRNAGNSKYLYKNMREQYPEHEYYYVTKDTSVPNRIEPLSKDFYRYLARSKVVIFETWLLKILKKREGQIRIQTWHATTVKKLLFDTTEALTLERNKKHRVNKYNEISKWDYFIVENENVSKYYESAFMLRKEQILPFRYPRVKFLVDNMYNDALKQKIKEKYGIPGDKKIVLYAPTWRDYNIGKVSWGIDTQYLVDMEKLGQLLGDEYVIVFKDHNFKRKDMELKGDFIAGHDFETQEIIMVSDCVISDYSSIVFDAMAVNIPILIYANDVEKYQRCRGVYTELYNDLLLWGTLNEEDIAEKIKNYSVDEQYLKIKDKYCYKQENDNFMEFIHGLLDYQK